MQSVTPAPGAPARPHDRVAALDGLRGLALLGMLAWHAQVGWVKGGFARMTIFFVLSGYLAAASWLSLRRREVERPFGTFWRRRVRRLLPLTVLGVALGVAVTAWIGSDAAVRNLRGDAASVLVGASNWRFLANGQSYGELFERPSAFQHFWSLSLEEQCFWLLPLVVAGAALVAGRRAWALVLGAGVALAAIPAVIAHSPDAAYYGTHVRGGEFLVGVTLALVLERSGGRVPDRWRTPVQVVGALSLAGLVLVMLTVDRSLGWLYQGGLGLFAIPAVAVVAACRAGRGPATVALSVAPLAMLGRAAFSIYALHWPLFQVMTPDRTGLHGGALAAAQMAVGIGVGLLVYRFVERPLLDAPRAPRTAAGRLWAQDRRALPLLAGGVAAVVVATLLVPRPPAPYDLRVLEARLSDGHDLDLDRARQVPHRATAGPRGPLRAVRRLDRRVARCRGPPVVRPVRRRRPGARLRTPRVRRRHRGPPHVRADRDG
jgi:peptidoglycan/LPS O-acetylase OafA/YrhL